MDEYPWRDGPGHGTLGAVMQPSVRERLGWRGQGHLVAEKPVAVVERTVAKKGTADLAKAYLNFLYSDEGQEIAAKHHIRPRSQASC